MSCECLETIDKELAETGHQLDRAILWDGGQLLARPYSRIMRKDNLKAETRSGKPRVFSFTFCPFCGGKYAGDGQ